MYSLQVGDIMYQINSSGNAKIIIRTLNSIDILGVSYAANDVIAYFDKTNFNIVFQNANKNIDQGSKILLNYNVMSPKTITINPLGLNHSILNFIAAEKASNINIAIPAKEDLLTDINGSVFLKNIPLQTKEIYVKDVNRLNKTFSVDYTTGVISGLTASSSYTCFYYYEQANIATYKIDKISTPYFSIEIIGQNNINDISRNMLIFIPKVSINIMPTLNFEQDKSTAIGLDFLIIDGLATINYY